MFLPQVSDLLLQVHCTACTVVQGFLIQNPNESVPFFGENGFGFFFCGPTSGFFFPVHLIVGSIRGFFVAHPVVIYLNNKLIIK